jgi:protein gp37
MSDNTGIAWTTATWNPTTGCDRVSEGCDHCYALTLAGRLKAMGNPRYQVDGGPRSGPGFGLTLHPDKLDQPHHWRKPRRIFVNSMSDLGHEGIPFDFFARIMETMALTPQHTYQVLTKRPAPLRSRVTRWYNEAAGRFYDRPLRNVWLGVSVENQRWADIRVPHLLKMPAAVRFLSCEPLLGPVDLLDAVSSVEWVPGQSPIDWVIVGGESGAGFRAMNLDWARDIRDLCLGSGVAFFYKQGSGPRPEMDRTLDGEMWEQFPDASKGSSTT